MEYATPKLGVAGHLELCLRRSRRLPKECFPAFDKTNVGPDQGGFLESDRQFADAGKLEARSCEVPKAISKA